MAEPEEHTGDENCPVCAAATDRLRELSVAMYGVIERRSDAQHLEAIILLDDPQDTGHNSVAVFGYDAGSSPVATVIANMASHLHAFGLSFGVHIDVYADGVRVGKGRTSPDAS